MSEVKYHIVTVEHATNTNAVFPRLVEAENGCVVMRSDHDRVVAELDTYKSDFEDLLIQKRSIEAELEGMMKERDALAEVALEGRRIMRGLYDENEEYCAINNLPSIRDNHFMKQAREWIAPLAEIAADDIDWAKKEIAALSNEAGDSRPTSHNDPS